MFFSCDVSLLITLKIALCNNPMIICDFEMYAGNCLAVMLLPIVLAVASSSDTRYSSIMRNICMHCVRYVNCLCLSCTIVAMLTTANVETGVTCLWCLPLMYAKSHCITGSLLVFCVG